MENSSYVCKQVVATPTPPKTDDSVVSCETHSDGIAYIPKMKSKHIGQYYFESKAACENAISSAANGWICIAGSTVGSASAYSLKKEHSYGEFYFHSVEECQQSLSTANKDFICSAGPNENLFVPYDIELNRVAARKFTASISECGTLISSGEAAKSKTEKNSESATTDCSSVRLDDAGGSMEHVAVREQGSLPICYAEVAAQMADAWRFTHGDTNYSFQSSALFAALKYDHTNNSWELDGGGFEKDALKQININGTCSKSATIETMNSWSIQELMSVLKNIRQRKFETKKDNATITSAEQTALSKWNEAPYCLDGFGALPNFDTLIKTLETIDPKHLIAETVAYPCKGDNLNHVKIPPLTISLRGYNKTPEEIATYFATHLKNKKSMPIDVAICGSIFENKYQRAAFTGDNSTNCRDHAHAMLLIGKRKNPSTEQCEFLLRNSWGTECGSARINFKCENGSVWMDADTLSRITIHAGELEKEK